MPAVWYLPPSNFRIPAYMVSEELLRSWSEFTPNRREEYVTLSSPDNFSDIKSMYRDMLAGDIDTKNPDDIRKIAALCRKYINGNIVAFAKQQQNNPHISFYGKEFILDTLRFIATGKRHISCSTQIELSDARNASGEKWKMSEGGLFNESGKSPGKDDLFTIDMKQLCKNIQNNTFILNPYNEVASDIYLWLARSGGPEDIVCTMYIVFCCYNF